jgi:hypothetical protein
MADELGSVTVWMVELGGGRPPTDTRGRLSIEEEALVFEAHETASRMAIPFADAHRAKRLRLSPVLLLRWREASRDRQTAFYFVQPPPLEPPEQPVSVTPPGPFEMLRGPSKRRQRRQNANFLTVNAGPLRPTILAWADELERRIADARRGP